MTRVVHNEVEQLVESADCENLEEVLERCAPSCDDEPHLFTHIRIDGLDLPEDSYDRLADISIDGVERIEVQSRPTIEIALSSLQHSSEYVTAIRNVADQVADLFRKGRSEEANDLLAKLSDSLGILLAAVSGAASAMPQVSEMLLVPMSELVRWLDQVIAGQSRGDWVQVADILEYEVGPQLDAWAGTMLEAREQEGQGGRPRELSECL